MGTFGGSNFGAGSFSGPSPFMASGASKLGSFAAPLGANKGFGSGGTMKSEFGGRASDDEGSGSEGDRAGEKDFEVEGEETDPRFQYQESTFSMHLF